MLRKISTAGRLIVWETKRRTDGRLAQQDRDDREGEVLEAPGPRRGSSRDARLLVREATGDAPEREARRCRRRNGEETAAAPDGPARAERRQARHPGAPGARRRA